MRLIDADKLTADSEFIVSHVALVKQYKMKHQSGCNASTCEECFARLFKYYVHLAPTVDAVPAKHGHWIEKEYEYGGLMAEKMFCTCSVCGKEQMQKLDDNFKLFLTPYCANCGTKMDGGENNEIQ